MHEGREVTLFFLTNSLQQKMEFLNLVFQANRIMLRPLALCHHDCRLLGTPAS